MIRICRTCSSEFSTKHSRKAYCSSECSRIGAVDRGKKWASENRDRSRLSHKRYQWKLKYGSWQRRFEVIDRDGGVCLRCGSGDNLCVHHIDEDTSNNTDDNLETLCQGCHVTEHNKRRGFLGNQWTGSLVRR